jgi:hypothetical protein
MTEYGTRGWCRPASPHGSEAVDKLIRPDATGSDGIQRVEVAGIEPVRTSRDVLARDVDLRKRRHGCGVVPGCWPDLLTPSTGFSRSEARLPPPGGHRQGLAARSAATCFIDLRSGSGEARSRCPGCRSDCGCPRRVVWLSHGLRSPGTAGARRGSRGVCSARSSSALPLDNHTGSSNGRTRWCIKDAWPSGWTRTNGR